MVADAIIAAPIPTLARPEVPPPMPGVTLLIFPTSPLGAAAKPALESAPVMPLAPLIVPLSMYPLLVGKPILPFALPTFEVPAPPPATLASPALPPAVLGLA
jgi:hypothetical protein